MKKRTCSSYAKKISRLLKKILLKFIECFFETFSRNKTLRMEYKVRTVDVQNLSLRPSAVQVQPAFMGGGRPGKFVYFFFIFL